jgi:hypothetical protein
MTDYADVSQANALIEEQARLTNAIGYLDNGGTVVTFTVAPASNVARSIPLGMTVRTADIIPTMPVTIGTIDPPAELLTAARDAMTARYDEITAELQALGVTGSPTR